MAFVYEEERFKEQAGTGPNSPLRKAPLPRKQKEILERAYRKEVKAHFNSQEREKKKKELPKPPFNSSEARFSTSTAAELELESILYSQDQDKPKRGRSLANESDHQIIPEVSERTAAVDHLITQPAMRHKKSQESQQKEKKQGLGSKKTLGSTPRFPKSNITSPGPGAYYGKGVNSSFGDQLVKNIKKAKKVKEVWGSQFIKRKKRRRAETLHHEKERLLRIKKGDLSLVDGRVQSSGYESYLDGIDGKISEAKSRIESNYFNGSQILSVREYSNPESRGEVKDKVKGGKSGGDGGEGPRMSAEKFGKLVSIVGGYGVLRDLRGVGGVPGTRHGGWMGSVRKHVSYFIQILFSTSLSVNQAERVNWLLFYS